MVARLADTKTDAQATSRRHAVGVPERIAEVTAFLAEAPRRPGPRRGWQL